MIKKIRISIFIVLSYLSSVTAVLAQSTAAILPQGRTQFLGNNGAPLASGKVYFYIPNTTTFKTTWQDAAKTIANANPVILDAGGRATIYGDGTYRQLVRDRNNNQVYDAVTASAGSGSSTTGTGDGDLVGTIKPWAGLVAPNQYAFAYGQELSRVTYSVLFTAITLQQTVTCTAANSTASGFSDTSQIPIGGIVESICFAPGTTVVSKTPTTVTFSNGSAVNATDTIRIFLYGNGNGANTFNLPDLRGTAIAGRDNMGGTSASRLTTSYFGVTGDATGARGGSQNTTLITGNLPPYTPAGSVASVTPTGSLSGTITANTAGANWSFPYTATTAIPIGGSNDAIGTGGAATAKAVNIAGSITTNLASGTFTGDPLPSQAFTGTAQGGLSTPVRTIQPTLTLNYIIKITPDSNSADASGVTSIQGMVGDIACGPGLLCTSNLISVTGTPPTDIVLAQNHILVGSATNLATDVPMSGDCSILAAGAITCTKSSGNTILGMAFQAPSAVAITGGSISNASITGLANPSTGSDAANKTYVDSVASGLNPLGASKYATAAVLPNTPTYANGASGVGATLTAGANSTLTVDGSVVTLNEIVLVKNQASAFENGQYYVSDAGSGGSPWVLTRCTAAACGVKYDTAATIIKGSYSFVTSGSVNAGTSYIQNNTITTVGTDAVNYSLFQSQILALANGSVYIGNSSNIATANALGTGVQTFLTTPASADLTIRTFRTSGYTSFSGAVANPGTLGPSNGAFDYSADVIRMFSQSNSATKGGGFRFFSLNDTAGTISNQIELTSETAVNQQLWLMQHGGRVGIGTTSPSTQLHSTGGVRFAGVPSSGIAACGDGSQLRMDTNGNLLCRLVNEFVVNCAVDASVECSDIQTKVTACTAAGGGTIILPAGRLLANNGIVFTGGGCILKGQGWVATDYNTENQPIGFNGTWLIQTTTANNLIRINSGAGGSGGVQIKDIAIWQQQPLNSGFAGPTAYPYVIYDNGTNTLLDNIYFQNVTNGLTIQASGGNYNRLYGACFTYCIRGIFSAESIKFSRMLFHGYYAGSVNTNYIAWIQNNATAMRLERFDTPWVHDLFSFGFNICLHISNNGSGGVTNAKFTNIDCDASRTGIFVVPPAGGTTAQFSNVVIQNAGVGGAAISNSIGVVTDPGSSFLDFSNLWINSSQLNAILTSGGGNDLAVNNLRIGGCSAASGGATPAIVAGASDIITVSGRYLIFGATCSVEFGGAGALQSSHAN